LGKWAFKALIMSKQSSN